MPGFLIPIPGLLILITGLLTPTPGLRIPNPGFLTSAGGPLIPTGKPATLPMAPAIIACSGGRRGGDRSKMICGETEKGESEKFRRIGELLMTTWYGVVGMLMLRFAGGERLRKILAARLCTDDPETGIRDSTGCAGADREAVGGTPLRPKNGGVFDITNDLDSVTIGFDIVIGRRLCGETTTPAPCLLAVIGDSLTVALDSIGILSRLLPLRTSEFATDVLAGIMARFKRR